MGPWEGPRDVGLRGRGVWEREKGWEPRLLLGSFVRHARGPVGRVGYVGIVVLYVV